MNSFVFVGSCRCGELKNYVEWGPDDWHSVILVPRPAYVTAADVLHHRYAGSGSLILFQFCGTNQTTCRHNMTHDVTSQYCIPHSKQAIMSSESDRA